MQKKKKIHTIPSGDNASAFGEHCTETKQGWQCGAYMVGALHCPICSNATSVSAHKNFLIQKREEDTYDRNHQSGDNASALGEHYTETEQGWQCRACMAGAIPPSIDVQEKAPIS